MSPHLPTVTFVNCKVVSAALRGLAHNSRHQVSIIDLTPFDACLPRACLELNAAATPTHPSLACLNVLWSGATATRKRISAHVNKKIRDRTSILIKEGTLKLPGLPDLSPEAGLPVLKKPTLDESKFEITAPMSDGTLRFHQPVLDVWIGQANFKELVAEHNKQFNPNGASFKAKREAPDSQPEEGAAITIDPGTGPKTKADVQALHPQGLHVIPGSDANYELLITKTGELFLSALTDTVVTSVTNLGGFGQGFYEVGEGASKVMAAHEKWMEFKVTDDELQCIFLVNPSLKEQYKSTPQTMNHFLQWLEGQGQINAKLVNHTIERVGKDSSVKYKIESETASVFEVQQKFAGRTKPTRETALSLIDIKTAKSSTHVKFVQTFTCPRSSCFTVCLQRSTFLAQECLRRGASCSLGSHTGTPRRATS